MPHVFIGTNLLSTHSAVLVSPQHFDHCDETYRCEKSTYNPKPHLICQM